MMNLDKTGVVPFPFSSGTAMPQGPQDQTGMNPMRARIAQAMMGQQPGPGVRQVSQPVMGMMPSRRF